MNEKKKKREQRDLCFFQIFLIFGCVCLSSFFLLFFIFFLFSLFFVLSCLLFSSFSSCLCERETALFLVSNTSLWNIICFIINKVEF